MEKALSKNLKPYFRFGISSFKVSLGYNIPRYNKKRFCVNSATLSISNSFLHEIK